MKVNKNCDYCRKAQLLYLPDVEIKMLKLFLTTQSSRLISIGDLYFSWWIIMYNWWVLPFTLHRIDSGKGGAEKTNRYIPMSWRLAFDFTNALFGALRRHEWIIKYSFFRFNLLFFVRYLCYKLKQLYIFNSVCRPLHGQNKLSKLGSISTLEFILLSKRSDECLLSCNTHYLFNLI